MREGGRERERERERERGRERKERSIYDAGEKKSKKRTIPC